MAGFPFMRQAEAFRSSLPFILLLAVFILPDVCVVWHALPSHFSPNSKNQPCEITELTSRGRDPALRIKLVRLSYRIR